MLPVRLVDAICVSAALRVVARTFCRGRSYLLSACLLLAGACAGAEPPELRAGALAAATDTSHAARAVAEAAEVKRFRDIAAEQRQIVAEYTKRTARIAAGATDRRVKLKANAQARAAAADQIADELQTEVDFHVAEANREAGR